MNRRDFLRRTALVGASSSIGVLTGCIKRLGISSMPPPAMADLPPIAAACGLPPVRVSEDREIRTVTGLRPFRPSGFRVAPEKLGDKTVIHNYGHGGGGITLSWGTAKLACDLGLQGHSGEIAVLGSGAVGLATARLSQEAGHRVTIYTKALPPETTSNIAGGQWYPAFVSDANQRTPEFDHQFAAASEFAYRRYQIMVGAHYGVRWMRNYFLSDTPFSQTGYLGPQGVLRTMAPELRDLTPDEYPFPVSNYARQFDGMLIEPPIYLAAMFDEFQLAGGKIVIRELRDRGDVMQLAESLVFNCTGLGAKDLFSDKELIPIKGQLTFLLPQPEVRYAVCPGDLYMFSRSDGILLGGTHEPGVWSLQPDLIKKREIMAKQAAFFSGFRLMCHR